MEHIYLNLKRFDIPKEYGGVNSLAPVDEWARMLIEGIQGTLAEQVYAGAQYTVFFPEAHILGAAASRQNTNLRIGCQGVHREDTAIGGNFGAFTSLRTANAAKALGCDAVIIGHCEERREKAGILAEAGVADTQAINRLLNREILRAQAAGLDVLYCIGESADEQSEWEKVLGDQLAIGLEGIDKSRAVIAYEPIWSIGPGKTPAGKEYITKIAKFVKQKTGGMDIVYGGGLKADNAAMLASMPEINGGLIALTRFSGDIGFYPEEYLEIIRLYLSGR